MAVPDEVRRKLRLEFDSLLNGMKAQIEARHDALLTQLVGMSYQDISLHEADDCALPSDPRPPRNEASPKATDTDGKPALKNMASLMGKSLDRFHGGQFDDSGHDEEEDVVDEAEVIRELNAKLDEGQGGFKACFSAGTGGDLDEAHYTVEHHYHETGFCRWIATSKQFANGTLVIIMLNACYIGIDSDWNHAKSLYEAPAVFIFFENFFCCYFVFEIVVRFGAFRTAATAFRDGWFRFDFFLVALMVWECWLFGPIVKILDRGSGGIPVEPLRLLRLLRLTRMTRLARSIPELVTFTKSMLAGLRAVASSLFFVIGLTYTFAIILATILDGQEDVLKHEPHMGFGSIPNGMWTLLLAGTFLDGTSALLTQLMFSDNWKAKTSAIVFILFILLTAVTVMNMLIGVLCEVVSQVSQKERDDKAIHLMKESILLHLRRFDDGDGMISRDEFQKVMRAKSSLVVLRRLNIDELFLVQLSRIFFPDTATKVSVKAVMELMLLCRGDLSVSVEHLGSAQQCIIQLLSDHLDLLSDHLDHLTATRQQAFDDGFSRLKDELFAMMKSSNGGSMPLVGLNPSMPLASPVSVSAMRKWNV